MEFIVGTVIFFAGMFIGNVKCTNSLLKAAY